jgi:hypothetical protein
VPYFCTKICTSTFKSSQYGDDGEGGRGRTPLALSAVTHVLLIPRLGFNLRSAAAVPLWWCVSAAAVLSSHQRFESKPPYQSPSIFTVSKAGPPLCSSGQRSWLQIQWSRFNSWRYQIFWEVVGLGQRPLSLVSTTEELLGRKSSGACLENREYGRRNPLSWHATPSILKSWH